MSASKVFPPPANLFNARQRRLPGLRQGGMRPPRAKMRQLVAYSLLVDTARSLQPRERVAEVTEGTLQSASNHLLARTGLNAETLLALMAGFPTLQKAVSEVTANFARDPEILDRKLAELEAHWLSLRQQD